MVHRKQLEEAHLSNLHDAEYWRKRAEEIRVQAEQMSMSEHKRDLLDIATGYEQLAMLAEEKKIRGGMSVRASLS